MILSHQHKFIFLKTSKTAGTSIEIALSKFCGPEDIITRISPEDEQTRTQLGYRGPQNDFIDFSYYTYKDLDIFFFTGRKKKFYNHIPAKKIKHFVGKQIWNNYYKFCFERNPWDRLISLYYWRYKQEPRPSISEFIDSKIPYALKRKGFEVYTIKGKIAVDRVYFYENLEGELKDIQERLGLSEKLQLPITKANLRKDRRNYREIFSPDEKEKVAKIFAEEIATFGYQY